MELKQEKALNNFKSGFNCAQSVLTAFSEELKFDNSLALNISAGFGSGMGRLQETCGAVTGAFMAIGIYNSKNFTDTKTGKEKTIAMVQDFDRKFKSIYKTTNCMALLGCDLKTEDGHKTFNEKNLKETVCQKCVVDAVKILEELMK